MVLRERSGAHVWARRTGARRAQVSAGYDAHWRDPLAGLQMRSSTYHRLARQLKALADRLCGARGAATAAPLPRTAAACAVRNVRAQTPGPRRAGGRLVFMLEGGYDLKALGESVAETFRGLLGQVCLGGGSLRVALPPWGLGRALRRAWARCLVLRGAHRGCAEPEQPMARAFSRQCRASPGRSACKRAVIQSWGHQANSLGYICLPNIS
jgi:hypothetical protein